MKTNHFSAPVAAPSGVTAPAVYRALAAEVVILSLAVVLIVVMS